jgi:hypothetical protein
MAVHEPQRSMCHGELRIHFDGFGKKRNRIGLIGINQLPSCAVGFQRF